MNWIIIVSQVLSVKLVFLLLYPNNRWISITFHALFCHVIMLFSVWQIIDAKSFGACFLSTISTKKDICDLSHKYKLPILCGCATFEDTMSAVDLYQVQALKFYPSTKVLPNDLKVILTKLSSYFENFKKLNHYRGIFYNINMLLYE